MKTYISYQRDDNRRPIVTRCLVYDPEYDLASFGQAVCSDKDNPNKKIGKSIAIGRAKKAIGKYAAIEKGRKKDMRFIKAAADPHYSITDYLNEYEMVWLQRQIEQEAMQCM